MKSFKYWISIDAETSGVNMYACKIDRFCVCLFDIKTGHIKEKKDINFRKGTEEENVKELQRWMATLVVTSPNIENIPTDNHSLYELCCP